MASLYINTVIHSLSSDHGKETALMRSAVTLVLRTRPEEHASTKVRSRTVSTDVLPWM